MYLEFTGTEVITGVMITIGLLIIVVHIIRVQLRKEKRKNQNFLRKQLAHIESHELHLKPYRHRSRFLGIGLANGVFLALLAMNWTTYNTADKPFADRGPNEPESMEIVDLIIPPPPPPIPLPPKRLEIEEISDELIDEDQSDLLDMLDDLEDNYDDYVPDPPNTIINNYIPPPLPEEKSSDVIDIFKVVEEMPLFANCKEQECSDMALLSFIYRHVKYPALARENGIEGRVTVEFVVEKDGLVSNIAILRGIGAECDDEVVRVVKLMNIGGNNWTPGRQRGIPVRVLYRLPITFSLN